MFGGKPKIYHRAAWLLFAITGFCSPVFGEEILQTMGAFAAVVGAANGMAIPAIQGATDVDITNTVTEGNKYMNDARNASKGRIEDQKSLLDMLKIQATEGMNKLNQDYSLQASRDLKNFEWYKVNLQAQMQEQQKSRDHYWAMMEQSMAERSAADRRQLQRLLTSAEVDRTAGVTSANSTVNSSKGLTVRSLASATVREPVAQISKRSSRAVLNPMVVASNETFGLNLLARGSMPNSLLRSDVNTDLSSFQASMRSSAKFEGTSHASRRAIASTIGEGQRHSGKSEAGE